ncbi:MAG TPA: helix-turn-helix transcriptional regulator [Candidatus Krumholzibacteria bacterium]|nr:helix-turn-helix transcriptional regulator [Candidatus Krumholzibacteria bacterium]
MSTPFGTHIRARREAIRAQNPDFSLRKVASRIGVQPSYLSKIERGDEPPPTEARIRDLARELDEDPDILLALAGKVSKELQEIIRRRPQLMGDLLRQVKSLPDHAVIRIVREVRDGDW